MLLSRSTIWAVANIICWGTQVEASSHRRRRDEAPPPKRQTDDYFQTKWKLAPDNLFPLNTNQNITYDVESDMTGPPGGKLPLMLLLTTAQFGVPTPDNTFFVTGIIYVCESEGDNCLWKKDAHGTATLNIAPYSQGDDVWKTGAYFVCFGTSQENLTKGVVQRCRSFSSFFTFQPPAQPAVPGLKARQGGSPVDLKSLVVPTSALQLFHTTDIVHQPGAAITPAPTTSSAASSSSSSSTQEGSLYTKVLTGSDGSLTTQVVFSKSSSTVTVSPTSTSTPISSPSKGKSGLPMGAIIGIAIGGAAILFAILVFAFLCYRRRRRAKTPSEQVLLAENMKHHPQSLEKLEVDISNHSANSGMLGSILETRPSSGPYDHVQSSAPYSGPLGPHRRTLSSQLAVAPAPATLSRGPSDASIQTPVSPSTIPGNDARSLNRRSIDARSVSIYDEPYQDIPLYGDARHMPQVYNSQNLPFLSQSPTPFLSEPGMSQEEIERLEEEERRIDAAIAEAERRR